VQLPKAVRAFVTGFDDQQYPEVIRLQVPASGSDPALGSLLAPGSRVPYRA